MYVRLIGCFSGDRKKGLPQNEIWKDGESVMRWWVGDDPRQLTMFDEEDVL